MKRIYTLGLVFAFCCGFVGKTILDKSGVDIVTVAYAEVGGMGYSELRRDRDFKRAVRRVVENYCSVDGDSISC